MHILKDPALLWLLGGTHIVITLTIYGSKANREYFTKSKRNLAIFIGVPVLILAGFFAMYSLKWAAALPGLRTMLDTCSAGATEAEPLPALLCALASPRRAEAREVDLGVVGGAVVLPRHREPAAP